MNPLSEINIHLENTNKSRFFYVFIWLVYSLVYMTKNCFSGALATIVDQGTLTLTQTTWIITAFYIVYTPLQIVGGRFADKYNPEKLILLGLLGVHYFYVGRLWKGIYYAVINNVSVIIASLVNIYSAWRLA